MKALLFLIITLLLISCSGKDQLTVLFENTQGLKEGDAVTLNDYKVGTVKSIGLNSAYKVCATVEMDKWLQIPNDSEFSAEGILSPGIRIVPGKSKLFLAMNDTVTATMPQMLKLDTLLKKISHVINESKHVKNQDSIIAELSRMNEMLDKINRSK